MMIMTKKLKRKKIRTTILFVFVIVVLVLSTSQTAFENGNLLPHWRDSIKPAPKHIDNKTVINNYIRQIGGIDNIKEIKKLKIVYNDTLNNLTITKYYKPPKYYCKITTSDSITFEKIVFDSKKAMQIDLTGKQLLDSVAFELLKIEALFNPAEQAKHSQSKLLGKVKMDGKNTFCLETKVPKFKVDFYSISNHLKTRTITTYKQDSLHNDTLIIDYSKYRDVKGVQFPHKIEMQSPEAKIILEISEIYINKGTGIHLGLFDTE